jgi:hypothetical protein
VESVRRSLNQSRRQEYIGLPFRVEDDLAALFGRFLVGASIKQRVSVGVMISSVAAVTEVEAAELLWFLCLLVVVGQVVGLCCADVNASRAGSAARHDHGATTVGIGLVLLRNLHLVVFGDHFRGCVLAGGSGSRVEEVWQGVWSCWN